MSQPSRLLGLQRRVQNKNSDYYYHYIVYGEGANNKSWLLFSMQKGVRAIYISYECLVCKTVFIIPVEFVEMMEAKGKYVACNFGHRNIRRLDRYGNIKAAMCQDRYGKTKLD